ncbi:maleate cis-trans isomerase family protein [Marinivivus vitaminiproducens]|uniref:maleate cis-trans isomerase family protein n=1 Tax=Marinivivus vitaminiproducens TaxID=3035935 RepID=UPI00279C0D81|nr:Asp/Glu racemase [Geminicoccaceae bacterium SCSIO 64248]
MADTLTTDLAVDREHMAYRTDGGIGARANLGLLVLGIDQTIEDEFRAALPDDGVALYGARLHCDAAITPENLRRMEDRIAPAARLLPPVDIGVIGFACTSGALVIGEAAVAERVREALPGVAVTDPVTAALAAFRSLGAKRVALLTPYVRAINTSLRDAFQARGLAIPVMGSFNQPDDATVARITPQSIEAAALELGAHEACDAVFVSCTSLRVARIALRIEQRLGKPVTSSNHALAWHMLRLAGIADERPGLGRLFRTPLAG